MTRSAGLILTLLVCFGRVWAAPNPAWVQYAPGGGAEVRTVIADGAQTCPMIAIDGADHAMNPRATAGAGFPLICSIPVPANTRALMLGTNALPVPLSDPRRIMVFGDTGCRLKGAVVQACNDPKAWPFPEIARTAATLKPDVVLHVGDYLYRESQCPPGNAGCAGSPYGDNWQSWNADFFAPAGPLLAVAPFIIVRGNHEDCQRAGPGFLRLLGPGPFDPAQPCADHVAPWLARVGNQPLVVMDDAAASDTAVDDKLLSTYALDLSALKSFAGEGRIWLTMHRPIWAAISGPLGIPAGGNATLIAASGDLSEFAPVSLLLSGHIHTFEAINYEAHIPPQVVAGFGGDNLDVTPANLRGTIFQGHSGVAVKDGLSIGGFGFLMMTHNGPDWEIAVYNASGTQTHRCVFGSGRLDCTALQ